MKMKGSRQEAGTGRGTKDMIRIEIGAETRKGIAKKIVIVATEIEVRGVGLEIEMMMLPFLMKVLRAGNTGNHCSF